MHNLTAVVLGFTLACLAGCVTEASEALDAPPVAASPQPFAGHEVSTMFQDEKARATASDGRW